MNANSKNLTQVHIAVFLFGLAGLFGKLIDIPSTIIVLARVFFASVFLGFVLLYLKQSIKLKHKKDYLFIAISAIILALHWITFFHAIQVSTVAIGLLSFSTFPIFTTFLEPYFFKEKIRISDIVLAVISFIGIAFVIPEFELANNITQGVLWGVSSGFSFAVLSIFNRKYVKNYSALVISFYQNSIATIVLVPFLFILQPVFHTNELLLLITLGVVFTALAHTLFINGLSSVKAQTASIITSLEPVYGILFAIVLLHEIPTTRVIIGGVIILFATFAATINSKYQFSK
jgi:drug/metabolite transporter (DMT)-like permease